MRSALHDTEQHLLFRVAVALEIIARSLRPLDRSGRRFSRARFVRRRFDALVERHDNVRAERNFDFERLFRREEMLGTVDVRAERHSLIVNLAEIAEAEDLVA